MPDDRIALSPLCAALVESSSPAKWGRSLLLAIPIVALTCLGCNWQSSARSTTPAAVRDQLSGNEAGTKSEPREALGAEALYALASPGVVTITIKNDDGEKIGLGSGFFLTDELVSDRNDLRSSADFVSKQEGQPVQSGYVVTNYHVIRPAVDAEIALRGGSKCVIWEVVAEDEVADLALLSVLVYSANSLTKLPLADESPRIGAGVYAIGSPQGLANSLSAGMVSGNREIKAGVPWLQTTAPISPGSSGGPLLTPGGKVVGVTTAILQDGQNLNFAVPVSELRRLLAAPYRKRELSQGASLRKEKSAAYHQPLGANSILRTAWDQIGQKKYDDAIATLESGKSSVPAEFNYLWYYLLGKANYCLAEKATHDNASAKKKYGRIAIESLTQARRLNSAFALTYESLFDYHNSLGEWEEARLAADSLVKCLPRCADAYYMRGLCYCLLQKHDLALADLQACIKLNPRSASGHHEMGNAWSALRQHDKAVDSYNTALSLDDRPFFAAMCHWNIGDEHQKDGKYQLAIHSYEKARAVGFAAEVCNDRIAFCRKQMR